MAKRYVHTKGVATDNYMIHTIKISYSFNERKRGQFGRFYCKIAQLTTFQDEITLVRVETLSIDKISVRTCVFAYRQLPHRTHR